MYSSRQLGQRREAAPREARGFTIPAGATTYVGASDAVTQLIKRIGERANFAFPIHVHMLRHAFGYALANAGHDTRRIQDCRPSIDPAPNQIHAIERRAVQGLASIVGRGHDLKVPGLAPSHSFGEF